MNMAIQLCDVEVQKTNNKFALCQLYQIEFALCQLLNTL
jgi:hypothetical protein